MATTQTDSFGMSPEFIAAQQAKNANTVSAQTETANIWWTPPENAQNNQMASPQPVAPVAPTPAPETPKVDSFGMSNDFIKQQQEKLNAETAKVETPKIETPTPKADTPKADTNIGTWREKEILANLNEWIKNAPQLFKDRAAYDAAYGYANADPAKRAIMDSVYKQQNIPKWENQIFNELASNSFAWDTSTNEYKKAKSRIDNINQFKTFTDTDFASSIKNGTIALGSKTYNDLISIPEVKAKIDKALALNRINKEDIKTDNVVNSALNNIVADTAIGKAFADGYITADEMNSLTTTPDIQAKQKDVETKKNDYDTLKAEYDNIDTAVDQELKWSGATSSYAAALKAERKQNIYKDLVVKMNVYNNAVGTLADMKTEAANLMSTNLGLYKDAQELEKQKQLEQFRSDLSIKQKQKEFEQELSQQAKIASDPTTATNQLLKQYADLGILPQRSSQAIIADIQNQVASWRSLWDALSDLNKAFQSKTEYQNAMKKKFAPEDTGWKLSNITYTDADGNQVTKTIEYNEKTGQSRGFNGVGWINGTSTSGQWVSTIPSGEFIDLTSSLTRTWNNVGQDTNNPWNIMAESEAGKNYAKSLGAVWFYKSPNGRTYAVFPDMDTGKAAALSDLSTKLSGGSSWANGDTTLGKFASGWTSGPNAAYNTNAANNYSRLTWFSPETRIKDIPQETLLNAIIANEGVNPNKSANIGVAYASSTPEIGKEFIGAIQRGDFTVSGDGTKAQSWYSPAKIDRWNSATAADKKKLSQDSEYSSFLDEKAQVMEDENANIYDIMKYSQGGKDMGEERLKSLGKFSQALSQISDLSKRIQETDTGPILGAIRSYNPYDTNAQALKAEINALIPNLARWVYGEVWVLTDADIENYSKTVPNLKSTQDVNKLVLAMTLKTMINGFKSQIQIDGSAGRDVSGFAGTVRSYENKVNWLLNEIGKGTDGSIIKSSSGNTYTF